MSISVQSSTDLHLATLSRDQRRENGVVYTPPKLAEFVLAQALEKGASLYGSILDPACGTGVFLVAAVDSLAADFLDQGRNIRGQDRRQFLRALSDGIWGMDIDAAAVEIARVEVNKRVETLTPGPLPVDFLSRNIRVGNFLKEDLSNFLQKAPELIVGNPPYVSTNRLSVADKDWFRAGYQSAFGRVELYTLFMERAARSLLGGGTWAFITPDKYLTSESARPVRELLLRLGTLQGIARFETHNVFADAATVPCVTVWRAEELPVDGTFENSRVALTEDFARTPEVLETAKVPHSRLIGKDWSVRRGSIEALVSKILRGHPHLDDRTSRISAGITTGYNPAFILNQDSASRIEPELIHKTIRGRDIRAYELNDRAQYILVPHVSNADGSSHLIDLSDYPRAEAWLQSHKDRLMARHCVREWGKAWWDLHDPVGAALRPAAKVLVPDLAKSNRFAADKGIYIPQHSAYYLIPTTLSTEILAAILNSSAIELLVRSSAPLVKDGFSRYRKQFLRGLPVPDIGEDSFARLQASLKLSMFTDVDDETTGLFGVDTGDVRRALRTLTTR